MASSFPVRSAPSDAQGSLGFYPGGKGQDFIFPAREGKFMVAGNQEGDAEIQEPSAPHSKFHLSQTTNTLSLRLMESAKALRKQHRSPFFSGKDIQASLTVSLLLSVSFPGGEQWSRWLVSTAFLQQGKIHDFTTSKYFTCW